MSQSGWLVDEEDFGFLEALPNDNFLQDLVGQFEEVRLDPRQLMRVENQLSQGSCQGHSLSSVMEWCYAVAERGKVIQLSRAMGYYESQRIDQISGDRGSTISGGVRLSQNTGLCVEEMWPYPSRYNPTRPQNWNAVTENAAKHKIKTAIRITSYDAFRVFLGGGMGGINAGISWGSSMDAAVIESFSGLGGGGHAIAPLCLSNRTDSSGRPYVWVMNSWGERWGSRVHPGWHEWSPRAIEQMLSHRFTVFVGLSDMDRPAARSFNLQDWKNQLKPYGV